MPMSLDDLFRYLDESLSTLGIGVTLSQLRQAGLVKIANQDLLGSALGKISISRMTDLEGSNPSDLCYFFSQDYRSALLKANPGVLITSDRFVSQVLNSGLAFLKTAAVVTVPDPYLCMALFSKIFAKNESTVVHLPGTKTDTDIHPTAVIDPTAHIGKGVKLGAYTVVSKNVSIGEGSVLYPHCFLGPGAKIGKSSILFSSVQIYENTMIGDRVRIHSSSVIGADGFGYAPIRKGDQTIGHQKIYHMGKVVIGDDVEIGAGTFIDRGTLSDTVIENQVKIDNKVQIGHNCRLEEGAIFCGGGSMAGNSSIGKFSIILGNSGIVNKIHVGERAIVTAHTLVTKDVLPGETVAGNPQRSLHDHFRIEAFINRMFKQNRNKGQNKE
jgi:UDP-3-O-[3-hydroxymyristoyl] glucosamine N-acyltransferase